MELRHLRYFCAVAEALNFTRAAEKLRVAQPALSRQIKALEDELGTALLDRNRQRVLLTDAGRLLLAHAQRILAQVDIATTAVREAPKGAAGELRLGLDWRLPSTLIAQTVSAYRSRYPNVEVTFRDLPMSEQIAALHSRTIHLGFVVSAIIGPDHPFATLKLFHTDTVAIVPSRHRLAGRTTIKLSELRREEWISVDTSDNGYRNYIQQTCRNAGFTPKFSRSGTKNIPGLTGLVSAGMGVALLPRLGLPADLSGVAVLPTDCDPFDLCAVWNRDDDSPLLHNFLNQLGDISSATTS